MKIHRKNATIRHISARSICYLYVKLPVPNRSRDRKGAECFETVYSVERAGRDADAAIFHGGAHLENGCLIEGRPQNLQPDGKTTPAESAGYGKRGNPENID